MKRQAALLMTTAAFIIILTACGGASNEQSNEQDEGQSTTATASGNPYNAQPTMASLQAAGWEASVPQEPQDTYTVPDVGYLETTSPNQEPIDLQFFESAEQAQAELDETKVQEPPFEGTTIGNVLVFDPDSDTAAVSSQDNLKELQDLLR